MEFYCYVKAATLKKHIAVVSNGRTPESYRDVYAEKAKGAFVSGQPTRVSDWAKLGEALVITDNQFHKIEEKNTRIHTKS